MKVKDVMHKGAVAAGPDMSLGDVARRMRDEDVGAIPVSLDGRVVGILTDRDITIRGLAERADVARLTAGDVMSKNVVCCSPNDEVSDAVRTMEARKVRRLPVVDGSQSLVGMLSLGDLSERVGKALSGELIQAVSAHHR